MEPMESPSNDPLNVIKGRDQEIGPFLAIFIIIILLIVGAIKVFLERRIGEKFVLCNNHDRSHHL